MKCIECGREIGIMDEICSYCGAEQYDDVYSREASEVLSPELDEEEDNPAMAIVNFYWMYN